MNRRLKVAIITHFFPTGSQPNRGRPVYQMSCALSGMADVEVLCVDPLYPRHKFLQPRTFLNPGCDASFSVPNVDVKYLRYRALPLITRPLNGYSCGRVVTPYLRESRPDIVMGCFVYPSGFGAATAARNLKIPAIVCALGSDIRNISYFGKVLVRQTMRKASFLVTVSHELRKRAIGLGVSPGRIRTIHNGCDSAIFTRANRATARAELKVDSRTELVVFTGRLVSTKGLWELLQSAAVLVTSRPRLRVVCIGEGVIDRELRQRVSQTELEGHVEFVGDQEPEEVARWLIASNVFCLPSYSEGCPNAVIEALACGRPVVASNVGGIPELVDSRCGILVPARDALKLADALSKALDRPWNEEEIASSFSRSWHDVAREMLDVCYSVVRDSGM